jgi:hypothetical protein
MGNFLTLICGIILEELGIWNQESGMEGKYENQEFPSITDS